MKYPVLCGQATATNPKLPKIQQVGKSKPKEKDSYNNKGILLMLGWK